MTWGPGDFASDPNGTKSSWRLLVLNFQIPTSGKSRLRESFLFAAIQSSRRTGSSCHKEDLLKQYPIRFLLIFPDCHHGIWLYQRVRSRSSWFKMFQGAY